MEKTDSKNRTIQMGKNRLFVCNQPPKAASKFQARIPKSVKLYGMGN